jgi:hypothetical protein
LSVPAQVKHRRDLDNTNATRSRHQRAQAWKDRIAVVIMLRLAVSTISKMGARDAEQTGRVLDGQLLVEDYHLGVLATGLRRRRARGEATDNIALA